MQEFVRKNATKLGFIFLTVGIFSLSRLLSKVEVIHTQMPTVEKSDLLGRFPTGITGSAAKGMTLKDCDSVRIDGHDMAAWFNSTSIVIYSADALVCVLKPKP